jgi:parallel beta-helix repeat protein
VHDNGHDDFDHGLYISSSDNLVDGCEIYNNSGWGVHVYDESNKKGKVNDNLISNNKIYRNGKSGRGSGVILSSGSGNQAYNNEIWENIGGIQIDYGAVNTEVHNNIIYRNNALIDNMVGSKKAFYKHPKSLSRSREFIPVKASGATASNARESYATHSTRP